MHRIHWTQPLPAAGQRALVGDDEAAHALRAKRLREGESVELLDGLGGIATGTVHLAGGGRRTELHVQVMSVRHSPEPRPVVEVWAATPKGGRVDEMVEGLSEVGAASWTPLHAARSIVEPRPTKLDRLARLAVESAKQCGRPWFLRIERERTFDEALSVPPDTELILADASGTPCEPGATPSAVRLLIGPEGGWEAREVEAARSAGARVARFGPHAMRIETAAVVAAAIVIDHLRPRSA